MIEYLTLILAIPLGLALATITKDEKQIYSRIQYFPVILWILALATAIFYTINKQIALTLTFIFITIFTWNKA
ncbi:hypothetical protein KAT36_04060 [Candidatus Pacearchaeota archaeon]|nr:hypothetical protein [Candidatus Pacearchaeota archaeon]